MKKVFLIANWKSNKTTLEARDWVQEESRIKNQESGITNREIIICPPFTLLPMMKDLIKEKNLSFKLGAQNVSPYGSGAYTGEINAKQIKEFADYVIIGHSERRSNFGETEDSLVKKVKQALEAGLTPIYCIQNESTFVPEGVTLVAYEPPTAIGTGNPDTPEKAEKVAGMIINKYPFVASVLYGGSVTSANIRSFMHLEHISGALIGGASLDAIKFTDLIKNASL